MHREIARLRAENTALRAALAHSKDPCTYCQLPFEEMAKCKHGFPGCSRADDMTGCREFGAAMQLHQLQEAVRTYLSTGISKAELHKLIKP